MAEAARSMTTTMPPLRRVQAGGRVVAYREAGRGPALVLLHGIGSGSVSWQAQYAELGTRFRVIAWDAPGYGGSDAVTPFSPAASDYANALLGLVSDLGEKRIHLLGHSLGALIAASFAARHPDMVASLILASPAAGYGVATEEARRARVEPRIADMQTLGPVGLAAKRARGLLSPAATPDAIALVRSVMESLRPDGYVQAARMLGNADILADAVSIHAPTLVIGASGDTVTPEDGCRRIAAAIPGASYVRLSGPGHASYVEDPASFNKQVISFLAGHP